MQNDNLFHEIDWEKLKDRLVFLQCTSLKDENGKEIYEGDILHFEKVSWTVKFGKGREESKWGDDIIAFQGFYLESVEGERISLLDNKENTRKILIAGNIYENPEGK